MARAKLQDINVEAVIARAKQRWQHKSRTMEARIDHFTTVYVPFLLTAGFMLMSVVHTYQVLRFFMPSWATVGGVLGIEAALYYTSYYHVRYASSKAWHIVALELSVALAAVTMNGVGAYLWLADSAAEVAAVTDKLATVSVGSGLVHWVMRFLALLLAGFIPLGQWVTGHGVARHIVANLEGHGESDAWLAVRERVVYQALLLEAVQRGIRRDRAQAWAADMVRAYFAQGAQSALHALAAQRDGAATSASASTELQLRSPEEVQDVQYQNAMHRLHNGQRLSREDVRVILMHNQHLVQVPGSKILELLHHNASRRTVYYALQEVRSAGAQEQAEVA